MKETLQDGKSSKEFNSNDTKIAGFKTIADWETLVKDGKEDKNINEIDWCEAFSFFEERIKTRYLDPIRCIQNMSLQLGEGFAMVNLQCSLIETIESFYNGWIYQHDKEELIVDGKKIQKKKGYYHREIEGEPEKDFYNQNIFESFFEKRSPFKENNIDGESFYKDVRCTLLHETQTKKRWKILNTTSKNIFYENYGDIKIIYRNNFQSALEEVIQEYKQAIVKGKNYGEISIKDLRENFKAKFNRICKIS